MTTLIITPLHKAITSLEKALAQEKNEFTRDAVIQRFKYTLELSWKLMRCYLEQEEGIREYSLKNIVRSAAKYQLIAQPENWFDYLEVRNLTLYAYNEDTAEKIYTITQKFYSDAVALYTALEQRL